VRPKQSVPLIVQGESGECGLACVAMLLAYHGQPSDLRSLREKWGSSAKGTSLRSLMATARELGLVARPLRVEPEDLGEVQLPCVLHWNFDHFVVLSRIDRAGLEILDPGGA
jgi:ATP-binding cassette, subfamily B, bacterial CvaB/MchF/RaxB